MHARFDLLLNQLWAMRTNSIGEEFMSGDNLIIDDSVFFASIHIAAFSNQVLNTMLVKHSKVDGSVIFHKEYRHSMHSPCLESKIGVLTMVRDSYKSLFIGNPTCLSAKIGSYVLKVSSLTGEFLRAKLFYFETLDFRTERMIVVDGEDNLHVMMGRWSYFVLVKLTNDMTVLSIRTKTRGTGISTSLGNQINLFNG